VATSFSAISTVLGSSGNGIVTDQVKAQTSKDTVFLCCCSCLIFFFNFFSLSLFFLSFFLSLPFSVGCSQVLILRFQTCFDRQYYSVVHMYGMYTPGSKLFILFILNPSQHKPYKATGSALAAKCLGTLAGGCCLSVFVYANLHVAVMSRNWQRMRSVCTWERQSKAPGFSKSPTLR
jgi:hypothetical protein